MSTITYPSADKVNLKLMITLTRCLHSINKREFALWKEHDLTPSQFAVLEYLYHKGPANMKKIMKNILSTGGNMTVVIDNLEKRKLALRSDDGNDRRAKQVDLTKSGRELMAKLFPLHVRNLREILNHINAHEKRVLIEISKKLGTSIEGVEHE